MTLGATTAQLINRHIATWNSPQAEGDWLFAPTPARADPPDRGRAQPPLLSHRTYRRHRPARPAPTPTRTATHLVDTGKLLKAQARLGHPTPQPP